MAQARPAPLSSKPAKFALIGVGKADWFRPPLPPNRTGGFLASGSPVNGVTSWRIDEPKTRKVTGFDPDIGRVYSPCPS
jgi:hypothetical protein